MKVQREWLEKLIYGGEASRRFTQDSPILPDVWLEFGTSHARNRAERVDLLLTPHRDASAAELCKAIRSGLDKERLTVQWQTVHAGTKTDTEMAYNQSTVVACLSLPELIRVVLPLSRWWRESVPGKRDDLAEILANPVFRQRVVRDLRRISRDPQDTEEVREPQPVQEAQPVTPAESIPADLLWMIRVLGTIILATDPDQPGGDEANEKRFYKLSRDYERLVESFAAFIADMVLPESHKDSLLWTVSRNRRAAPTIVRSTLAVKADAARRVFEIDCRDLAWAILDSGIDATHPAFRKKERSSTRPYPVAFEPEPYRGKTRWKNNTRVLRTFDFTRIRSLLSPEVSKEEKRNAAPMAPRPGTSAGGVTGAVGTPVAASGPAGGVPAESAPAAAMPVPVDPAAQPRAPAAPPPPLAPGIAPAAGGTADLIDPGDLDSRAEDLTKRLKLGRPIDWDELEGFLEVPHDARYSEKSIPDHEHGTHVAGILAADWKRRDWGASFPSDQRDDLVGVCPDLAMYDFRVLNKAGVGDEFTVMAALQFIRHLNAQRDQPMIHGANLSLSLKHDVANYACGRTPVCDECARLISSGVVVVAAAGNDGYMKFSTPSGYSEGYRSISISDPGNAEDVITVGATHRFEPHTYGVSYFSSRGPTGDGRIKPDLVAPGEKITAPVPNNGVRTKDGTSMAAPHVSGAAALLMARHRELLGQPARIKQILCGTATDLGRERYFQGRGMVDILRALQSV